MNDDIEYAMVQTPDGQRVPREAPLRSLLALKKDLLARGGKAPIGPDGQKMVWGLRCGRTGWHPRNDRQRSAGLAEHWARQRRVEAEIRQAKFNAEIREFRALCRSASYMAWTWARTFSHPGLAEEPNIFASEDEKLGWRLSRRGYATPPDWLVKERPALAGLVGR